MFTFNIQLHKRGFFSLSLLYLGIAMWQYLFLINVVGYFNSSVLFSAFYFALTLSMFLNRSFEGVKKSSLITSWAFLAMLFTALLVFPTPFIVTFVIVCVIGGLYSISLFAFFSMFCDLTTYGERGRVGGILICIPSILFPFLTVLGSLSGYGGVILICIMLNLTVLLPLKIDLGSEKVKSQEIQVFSPRTFVLYLIPWIIFSVINGISAPVVTTLVIQRFPDTILLLVIGQKVAAAFGALVGGVFADWIGRRLTLMVGLTTYGISTAISSFSHSIGVVNLSCLICGFSWGIFLVLYFLVVWGDLASGRSRFISYLSGVPFFFLTGLGYLVNPFLLGISVEVLTLLNVSFILLSNIPLIFSKELLPEVTRQEMEIRRFIDWIKKQGES